MSGGGDGVSSNINECSLSKVLIFLFLVLLKAFSSIWSKIIMSMSGSENEENEKELFQKPLVVTFCMFVGMSFALVMHVFVVKFRMSFPGYDHLNDTTIDSEFNGDHLNDTMIDSEFNGISNSSCDLVRSPSRIPTQASNTNDALVSNDDSDCLPENTVTLVSVGAADDGKLKLPLSMYFIMAIPALLDLGSTALMIAGLVYLDVSIFQMIGNIQFLFVALMKHYVLKNLLYKFHWVGVFWIVVSVLIGGSSALLVSRMSGNITDGSITAMDLLALVIAGVFLNALQVVIEEKLMGLDVPVPPLLLIGVQGLWGVVLSIVVMFPVGYALPGNDHGSYENPFDSWDVLMNSRNLQLAFFIDIVGTLGFNVLSIIAILELGSIWYSITTNVSLVIIWMVDLFIFYCINPMFGEAWTKYSYIQIAGIAVLLYGSAIYNAPNKGSVLLEGQWWAFGIDCSKEYSSIKREQGEADADVEVEEIEEPLLATCNEGIV